MHRVLCSLSVGVGASWPPFVLKRSFGMAETQTWDQLSRLKHVVQEGRGAESFAETIEEYLLLPTYIAFFSVGLSVSLSLCLSLCLFPSVAVSVSHVLSGAGITTLCQAARCFWRCAAGRSARGSISKARRRARCLLYLLSPMCLFAYYAFPVNP